jgi:hypothetical protein
MKPFFQENENILIPLSQSTNYDDLSEVWQRTSADRSTQHAEFW